MLLEMLLPAASPALKIKATSDCVFSSGQMEEKHAHMTPASNVMVSEQLIFRGAIDWVACVVTLQSPTQFRHLQARTHKVWGKTHFEEVPGSNAKSWRFKVQDPTSPGQFMEDAQCMRPAGDRPITEGDIQITGIEIALDVYHAEGNRAALIAVVSHMLRHQACPPEGELRITGHGTCESPTHLCQVLAALHAGGVTVRTGPMYADHTCRFYFKDYDTLGDVKYAPLPQAECRARFENTLIGEAVPFRTVQEWRDFKFESLSDRYFSMVMPVAASTALGTFLQAQMIQLGRRPDSFKRRLSDRRKRGVCTRRDSDLNDKIRQALRGLTRSQSCQNSVKPLPKLGLFSLGEVLHLGCSPKYRHIYLSKRLRKDLQASNQSIVTRWCHGTVWKEQRGPPRGMRPVS